MHRRAEGVKAKGLTRKAKGAKGERGSLAASRQVLLVGNPNAGKSTLFNALTGGHAKVGNWHGVTVGELSGELRTKEMRVRVTDLPGLYSTDAMSMEERFAADYIARAGSAFLLFVCECSALPRALPLFSRLGRGRECALVLTKRRRFERAGGRIDPSLSRILSIPVLCSEGMSARRLREEIVRLLVPKKGTRPAEESSLPAQLPQGVYRPPREQLSRIDRLLTNGLFCLPLFAALMLGIFWLTFAPGLPGDMLKGAIDFLFTERLPQWLQKISSPVLRSFFIDGLCKSVGTVLGFLPQITMLFFALIFMEESGLLSRLAFITDGWLSAVGLSGRAVFSLLMGFGCTAAAILTTRGLDDRKMQRRVILCLPYLSCSAKLPVFLTLSASFFQNPFFAVVLLYLLGIGIAFSVALILKGKTPPFVLELAPLQIPQPKFVAKALFFQLRQFIIKLGTVILAFFLFSWLMSSFNFGGPCAVEESLLAALCRGMKYLFAPIGMNDWKIAYAALSGLIAKENVAGALGLFYGGFPYSARSAFSFAVFILTCSPCVSAIAAGARELGWKSALLYALLQTVSALLLSYLTYFLLGGGGAFLLLLLLPLILLFVIADHEKIHRRRAGLAQKLHR